MERKIILEQLSDFQGDLINNRDKLQFLEEAFFSFSESDFLDNTDKDKNDNILCGVRLIIEEIADDLGKINERVGKMQTDLVDEGRG